MNGCSVQHRSAQRKRRDGPVGPDRASQRSLSACSPRRHNGSRWSFPTGMEAESGERSIEVATGCGLWSQLGRRVVPLR